MREPSQPEIDYSQDVDSFKKLVVDSLKAINKDYLPRYRKRLYERILCYEFYYQFRKLMKKTNSRFSLHGELDKRYKGISIIPDFIFHVPFTEENIGVIEFKNVLSGSVKIMKDAAKIAQLTHGKSDYKIGVLVIYGDISKLNRMREKLNDLSGDSKLLIIFLDEMKCSFLQLNGHLKTEN